MQTLNATVRLNSDLTNTVRKNNITVPEAALLTGIHGDGSLTDLELSADIETTDHEERERLASIYGGSEDNRKILANLFPGAHSPLPRFFLDIGIELLKTVAAVVIGSAVQSITAESLVKTETAPAAEPLPPAAEPAPQAKPAPNLFTAAKSTKA